MATQAGLIGRAVVRAVGSSNRRRVQQSNNIKFITTSITSTETKKMYLYASQALSNRNSSQIPTQTAYTSLASNGKQEKPHLVSETRCTSSPSGTPKNFNIRNIINFATEGFCLFKIHKILPYFFFIVIIIKLLPTKNRR